MLTFSRLVKFLDARNLSKIYSLKEKLCKEQNALSYLKGLLYLSTSQKHKWLIFGLHPEKAMELLAARHRNITLILTHTELHATHKLLMNFFLCA